MGRQDSVIQLVGAVGNLSFYKTRDGYMARKKGGVTADRIKFDPKYARTRENLAEFARAGRAAKVFRSAFLTVVPSSDSRMTSRLIGAMREVIRQDLVNPHGERNVIDGEALVLQGFEFNLGSTLKTTFRPQVTASIDRATGSMVVDIPAFEEKLVAKPDGATHFRLISAGAAIDFGEGIYTLATAKSDNLAISQAAHEPFQLSQAVTPGSTHPLFLALGIEFVQVINNVEKPLNNGAFNAMAIVKVDSGASE